MKRNFERFALCFFADLSTPIKEYTRDNDVWSYDRTWSQNSDRKSWSRQAGGEALRPLERCSDQPRSSEVVFCGLIWSWLHDFVVMECHKVHSRFHSPSLHWWWSEASARFLRQQAQGWRPRGRATRNGNIERYSCSKRIKVKVTVYMATAW